MPTVPTQPFDPMGPDIDLSVDLRSGSTLNLVDGNIQTVVITATAMLGLVDPVAIEILRKGV